MIFVFSDPKYSRKTYNPQMVGDLTERTRKWSDGSTSKYSGKYPRSVVKYQCREERLHPTQKPQELCEWLVNSYSNEGDVVLDFTMGSGTSIHAAKILKRRYIGIERDETIFEIARRRIIGEKNIRATIKRRDNAGNEVDTFVHGTADIYSSAPCGQCDADGNEMRKGRAADNNRDPLKNVFQSSDDRRNRLRAEGNGELLGTGCYSNAHAKYKQERNMDGLKDVYNKRSKSKRAGQVYNDC